VAELDLDALKLEQNARHRRDCAYERWARRTEYTKPPPCDCDWPAILTALDRAERVEAAARALFVRGKYWNGDEAKIAALCAALADASTAQPAEPGR
jgi:hypothetical protein